MISSAEQQKCADMGSAFQSKGLIPAVQCLYADSVTDCMEKIKVTDVYCHFLKDSHIHSHKSLRESGF